MLRHGYGDVSGLLRAPPKKAGRSRGSGAFGSPDSVYSDGTQSKVGVIEVSVGDDD